MKSFNRIATSIALATLCTVSTATTPLTAMAEGLPPTQDPSVATEKRLSLPIPILPPASNHPPGRDAVNQGKALKESLTPEQQKQVKAVLGQFVPQFQELAKQLKAPAQDGSRQLPNAQVDQHFQAVSNQLQAIQEQIASQLSSVLSPEQLELFKGALKPVGDISQAQQTNSTVSTDYNSSYGDQSIYYLRNASIYSFFSYFQDGRHIEAENAYVYATLAYAYASTARQVDTAFAYSAYTYAQFAWHYAYSNLYYHGGINAYFAHDFAYSGYLSTLNALYN